MGNMLDKRDKSTYNPFGRDEVEKKERFCWASPSEQGVFMTINKTDLNLDDAYQRSASSNERVTAIAGNWDWRLFGTLLVVMRGDGSYWIVDGGHRARASFYRKDIVELPCMVFEISEKGAAALRVEARAFIGKGSMRSAISSCGKFKAGVVAKNEIDLKADKIVTKNGYQVGRIGMGGAYLFSAIGALKSLISIDEQLAARVFAACAEIAEGKRIEKGVINGIFGCAKRTRAGVDILGGNYLEALKRAGIKGIERYIRDAKFESGKGGEVVEAKAILNLLNYKRRNRLSWE